MSDLQGTTIIAGEASESDDDLVVIPENVVCIPYRGCVEVTLVT